MPFREDGHLSGGALEALARNEARFSELERLEIAEHLAFCDACLQRYTLALEDGALLVPERSCQGTLRARIQGRALRLAASRYATAAAAVALSLTVLWGSPGPEGIRPVLPEDRPSVSRQLSGLTEDLHDTLRGAVGSISDFFDGLRPGQFI